MLNLTVLRPDPSDVDHHTGDDQADSSAASNPTLQAHSWVEIRAPVRLSPHWTRLILWLSTVGGGNGENAHLEGVVLLAFRPQQ